ncbi:MAG: hypothetical protein M1836_002355 [Candelina mexicana]|nr:MAG: hypothetical protein M1836_002355 [Candelina mexicana]
MKTHPSSAPIYEVECLTEVSEDAHTLPVVRQPGWRYSSRVFLIKLLKSSTSSHYPPEEEAFYVHRDVLAQSPLLASAVMESIKQPRVGEGPEILGLLLEYLYTKDYQLPGMDLKAKREQTTSSARLYIMANKYQVAGLQELIISKLKALEPLSGKQLVSMASFVYENKQNSISLFREYFHEMTLVYLARSDGITGSDFFGKDAVLIEEFKEIRDRWQAKHV